MKKVMIAAIIVILSVILMWQIYERIRLHKPIDTNSVSEIELWGGTQMRRNATKEEIENITKWFNSATDIRRNERFAGTTPDSGIIIKLKSRSTIGILRSGSDFEIQRDYETGRVSYWARQSEIKKLLDQLAKNKKT